MSAAESEPHGPSTVPLRRVADQAIALLAQGIAAQTAPRLWPAERTSLPTAASVARTVAEPYLRAGDPHRFARACLDASGEVAAVLCGRFHEPRPGQEEYGYLPPRYGQVALSGYHLRDPGTLDLLPHLLDELVRHACGLDTPELCLQVRAGDWPIASFLRSYGFRSDSVLAVRRAEAYLGPPPALRVRPAREDDRAALGALYRAEQDHHAFHTRTGTRPHQPEAANQSLIAARLAAARPGSPTLLVAESRGEVVGCVDLDEIEVSADSPGRRYLPARYGYIGLTSVLPDHRGRGVGTTLARVALDHFAARDPAAVMLHYVEDNDLSRSFWLRHGFAPYVETLRLSV